MAMRIILVSIIILTVTTLSVYTKDFFTNMASSQHTTNTSFADYNSGSCNGLKGNLSLNFENVGLKYIVSDFVDSSNVNCLNLQNNEIIYILPAAFRLTPNLLYVNLALNKISLSNFTLLSGHQNLRTLILDDNHCFFTEKRDVEFKTTFPRLSYLYLRGNCLQGISSLAFAPKLTHLYLSSNNLGNGNLSFLDDVPDTLLNLDLADNGIWSFNARGLTSVRELILDGNRIERLCGKSYCHDAALVLEGTAALERLSLARNALTSVEPDAFDDAEDLLDLDLSFNRIDIIRKSSFEKLEILQKLSLNNNLLSEIPDLCGPETLQYLSLANNRLEVVKNDSFCLIEKMRFLDLSNNRITIIETDAFIKLVYLELLNLSDNLLTSLPSTWLYPLVNLRILYLDNNRLKRLNDIALGSVGKGARLAHVYLRNNSITTFYSSSLFSTVKIVPNITLEFSSTVPPEIVSNNCICECDENNEIPTEF